MGRFLKKGNIDFAKARKSEYVDKTAMIQIINETLDTERFCSCVTRCRRFGKSMAAKMLYAYYDKWCDSRALFEDLKIAQLPSFEEHLNKYPVIYLDITKFTTDYKNDPQIVQIIKRTIQNEVQVMFPNVPSDESDGLMETLLRVAESTGERFVMIIDEWDAICREFEKVPHVMDDFVDLLRRMFKSDETSQVFVGVYMTGILPIKKYKTESALNNFREYSMVQPGPLAASFGFTAQEVKELCRKHQMSYEEMAEWYDGYQIGDEPSVFNPYSVMEAIYNRKCDSYFKNTGAFTAVADYIQMNYEGLKDDMIKLLAGGRCSVDITSFQNDMSVIHFKDDVFTVLIHLGYLAYDAEMQECYVPNKEIAGELVNAMRENKWRVADVVRQSLQLLRALWNSDEETVAAIIDQAHDEHTSILSYNNENSLACVLEVAFIAARDYYSIWRELPSGKGFADIVLLPLHNRKVPAVVLELKFNQNTEAAIAQIKRQQYPARLKDYQGEMLLCGINYDKEKKVHSCTIEHCDK